MKGQRKEGEEDSNISAIRKRRRNNQSSKHNHLSLWGIEGIVKVVSIITLGLAIFVKADSREIHPIQTYYNSVEGKDHQPSTNPNLKQYHVLLGGSDSSYGWREIAMKKRNLRSSVQDYHRKKTAQGKRHESNLSKDSKDSKDSKKSKSTKKSDNIFSHDSSDSSSDGSDSTDFDSSSSRHSKKSSKKSSDDNRPQPQATQVPQMQLLGPTTCTQRPVRRILLVSSSACTKTLGARPSPWSDSSTTCTVPAWARCSCRGLSTSRTSTRRTSELGSSWGLVCAALAPSPREVLARRGEPSGWFVSMEPRNGSRHTQYMYLWRADRPALFSVRFLYHL